MPITRQVCCRGLYPLLTRSLCRQPPHPGPPQTAGEPPQNHISLLGQWSSPALACSGCRGRGRSSPAWLCSERSSSLDHVQPARLSRPSLQKTFTESTLSAWQGARLTIYVLLKQHPVTPFSVHEHLFLQSVKAPIQLLALSVVVRRRNVKIPLSQSLDWG